MSNTVIPNTFQCYNLYIDRALQHLTDSEVRILWYSTRHILGWQDKIKTRRGHISLSMFENGFTDSSGNHYGPCGLGKAAIIAACKNLVDFKMLEKCGEPTEDGQAWELTTGDIQWEKMETRSAERQAKQKAKTQKATAAMINKRSGTSDVPVNMDEQGGTSDVTMQGTSDVTMQGNVARTQSNPLSNPSSNSEELNTSAASAESPSSDSHPIEEKASAFEGFVETLDITNDSEDGNTDKTTPPDDQPDPKPRPRNLDMDAITDCFKIKPDGYAGLLLKQLKGDITSKGKRLEYLITPGMDYIEIRAMRDWYGTVERYKKQEALPATAETLYERALEFRAQPEYQQYIDRATSAINSRMNAEPESSEPAAPLPPPDPAQAQKIDDIVNAMARGEAIGELTSI